jgi:hypothetical protein
MVLTRPTRFSERLRTFRDLSGLDVPGDLFNALVVALLCDSNLLLSVGAVPAKSGLLAAGMYQFLERALPFSVGHFAFTSETTLEPLFGRAGSRRRDAAQVGLAGSIG